ncbi:MAG: hypothetical protein NT007_12025 [Candidatus Kapabacteria bacterium]|nr:hypothetical protein [Candidatus Kapabacteria bacterium]
MRYFGKFNSRLLSIMIIFFLNIISIYSINYNDSLFFYWSFDDSTAKDFSGNGFHGTIVNNPIPVNGISGSCFYFNGKGNYITPTGANTDIGDFISLPRIPLEKLNKFTISLWVDEIDFSAGGGEAYIFLGACYKHWAGIMHSGKYPDFTKNVKFATNAVKDEPQECIYIPFDNNNNRNAWMFYVLVYDNGFMAAYRNGILIEKRFALLQIDGNTAGINTHWWFMDTERRQSAQMTGMIDEVKIYKIALHDSDIKKEYEKFTVTISADKQYVCEGDKVTLTAKSGYSKYFWSTGETTNQITVTNTNYVWLKALSLAGDTLFTDYIITIVPLPQPTLIGKTDICNGKLVNLSVVGKYKEVRWSNGSTGNSTQISSPGAYSVTVTNDFDCSKSLDFVVNAHDVAPIIDGSDVLCAEGENKLSVTEAFSSYSWTNGSTNRSIYVNQPGIYSVIVTDTSGCTGAATINVRAASNALITPLTIDFSNQIINTNAEFETYLRNIIGSDVHIISISTKRNLNEYTIICNPSLPATIRKNDSLQLKILFNPNSFSNFNDTLIIAVDAPCPNIYKIPIFAKSYSATVFFPDTVSKPSSDNFSIPLYLSIAYDSSVSSPISNCKGYYIKFHFNQMAFIPSEIQRNLIITKNIDGQTRIIEMSTDTCNQYIPANDFGANYIIGFLDGNVVFSDVKYTPIVIDSFYWHENNLITSKRDGSLRILSVCAEQVLKFEIGGINNFSIINVSYKIEIEIQTKEGGEFNWGIYDLLGNMIKSDRLFIDKSETYNKYSKSVNIEELASGTYIIQIKSAVDVYRKPILINH